MSALRIAYHEPGRSIRLADTRLTGEQLRDAITRIVETWNASIPRNRVRIVNQPRYLDLMAALRVCTPDEICAAIKWYGQQAWQRQRNAWLTFDAFLQEDRLTQWVESNIEHGEKAAEAAQKRSAIQQAGEARHKATNDAADVRTRQVAAFDALSPPAKHKLLTQAKAALPRPLQRNTTQVRLRAIAMMNDRRHQPTGKDSHGIDTK